MLFLVDITFLWGFVSEFLKSEEIKSNQLRSNERGPDTAIVVLQLACA